jgi:hypothetical protein
VSSLGTVQTSWTWADSGVSGIVQRHLRRVVLHHCCRRSPEHNRPERRLSHGLAVQAYRGPAQQRHRQQHRLGHHSWQGLEPLGWNLKQQAVLFVRGASDQLNSLSFDLNLFIKDAVARGYIQNTWGLTNVFAGFEIWSGGVGLETTDFAVTVN